MLQAPISDGLSPNSPTPNLKTLSFLPQRLVHREQVPQRFGRGRAADSPFMKGSLGLFGEGLDGTWMSDPINLGSRYATSLGLVALVYRVLHKVRPECNCYNVRPGQLRSAAKLVPLVRYAEQNSL